MKKGSHIDPEGIENLQDQIGIESSKKQIIIPFQMTLGGSNTPATLFNLSQVKILHNVSPGIPLYFFQNTTPARVQTPEPPKSTSTPITGATKN